MKKALFCTALFFLPCMLLAQDVKFRSPSFEVPYYRIALPLEIRQREEVIQSLEINGEKWEAFFLFKEEKNIDFSKPLEKGTYILAVDYAWRNTRKYKIKLTYKNGENQDKKSFEIQTQAPDTGGIPVEADGFYRIYRAEELVGLGRKGEIVTLTLTVAKKDFEEQGFVLLDGSSPIHYQVLGVQESQIPEKSATTHPVTLTYKIAFPLNMAPLEKKLLLILKGEPKTEEIKAFDITGEGWGQTVKSHALALEFHPQNGQMNTMEDLKNGIRLFNEAGVIHWNPGCHIPGIAWDHSFNWNPPPSFEKIAGDYLYITARRGPLQKIKEVDLEVRYTLPIDSPFFISETLMSIKKDLTVSAIRNDEMVLYNHLFDTLVYKDKKGKMIKMPLKEKEDFPDGLVHVAPYDCEWVGLLNSEKGYGFFSLRIDYVNTSLAISGNWLNKPGTYFYAPSDGKYVYWVRPLLYTWAEYTTRNLLTYVPRGSAFYEKNAYILLHVDKNLPDTLDILLNKLKNPVRIY
jgi:hypothetical protein